MNSGHKVITAQALLLCGYACTLIFLMVLYGLYCGHDGIAVAAGSAAIAGLATGTGGFTIGRATK